MYESRSKEEIETLLKTELSPYISAQGGSEELLGAAAAPLHDFDTEIESASRGFYIQTADSKEEAKRHGEMVDVYPVAGESTDHYKKRVLTEFQQISRNGTPQDILGFVSELFEIDNSSIKLKNISGEANSRVIVPSTDLDESPLTKLEAANLAKDIAAATYGIFIEARGTLEYISSSEYNNSNYDTSAGYATIDSNGDVTGGGTYSTIY